MADPLSEAEAAALYAGLGESAGLVLAVSGGPDSTALMITMACWRERLGDGPPLYAVTVDHGLRPEAAAEAEAVARLARKLGVAHETRVWRGEKPRSGLPAAARAARYRLLGEAARRLGASHIVTAHTRDDQAETVLHRLARGSGISGLAGMARLVPLDPETGFPSEEATGLTLARPLLAVPKARLIATAEAAGVPFATDPSNADPRYTRPRLRKILAALAPEGLTADRLALLAGRARRADAALEWAAASAEESLRTGAALDAVRLFALPPEIALRVLGRAVAAAGDEGPVELGKLEALYAALVAGGGAGRVRRTLAGALVTLAGGRIAVARAPGRRRRDAAGGKIFTSNDADSADSLGIDQERT